MTEQMFGWVVPFIRTALSKVCQETLNDWGSCFATASESRDPKRIHWMLEVLMEEPLRSAGSFIDSSRLYAVQGGLAQQEWRAGELLNRLLNFLKPYLRHPFQNVRDRIGSVLTNIFLNDISFESPGEKKSNQRSPNISAFIREVLPELELLNEEPDPEVVLFTRHKKAAANAASGEQGSEPMEIGGENEKRQDAIKLLLTQHMKKGATDAASGANLPLGPDGKPILPPIGVNPLAGSEIVEPMEISDEKAAEYEKRQVSIRLLQTVSKFIAGSLLRAFNGTNPDCFSLLPILCINEANEFEPNLANDCKITIAVLSSIILPLRAIPTLLEAVAGVMKDVSSWKAKCAALELLETSTFNNFMSIWSRPEWAQEVLSIVTQSIESDRLEVREKAATVLSGLLHSGFVDDEGKKSLLELYHAKARTKLKRKKPEMTKEDEAKRQRSILKRHIGVLGLGAFVLAFPYSVPEFMPSALMALSGHLNDPQPIPATVKKTLTDFKRTHQDNWQESKLKFSEDELSVLTDLLVSPSYYA